MIGPRLPHRITVFHSTGTDDNGNPQGVTTPNVPCRVEYGSKRITTATSEQYTSRAVIETRHTVQVGDILTLPDGTTQTAVEVRPISGLGGRESHREVYL